MVVWPYPCLGLLYILMGAGSTREGSNLPEYDHGEATLSILVVFTFDYSHHYFVGT